MNKQWQKEPWRIEQADDATITFTIALHGKRAWEMLLEDRNRYHSISHGWATDSLRDWEDTIAPALRRLFVSGRLDFMTKVPVHDSPNGSFADTRDGGQNRTEQSFKRSQLGFAPNSERQADQNLQSLVAAE